MPGQKVNDPDLLPDDLDADAVGHRMCGTGVLNHFAQAQHSFAPGGGIIFKRETLVITHGFAFWVKEMEIIAGHVRLPCVSGIADSVQKLPQLSLKRQYAFFLLAAVS